VLPHSGVQFVDEQSSIFASPATGLGLYSNSADSLMLSEHIGGSDTSVRLRRPVWLFIVLSVIWATGAGIHTHNVDVESAENFAKFTYKTCAYAQAVNHDPDLSNCDAERARYLTTWMKGSDANVAVAALVPLPFAWLAAFILFFVVRAQIIGFRAVVPWPALTPFKKLFVVFCTLASVAAIFFGIIMVLNLYVDKKVPAGLSSFLDVITTGNDFVTVKGTWTRTDLIDDTIPNPLQTSQIECDKAENRCTEALAYISDFVLMSEVVNYNIQSWTANAIVLSRDFPCATELFTLDLNTKAVSGAGHWINADDPLCRMQEDHKSSWTYQLSSGFKIYWGLRQKARPLLLRVFQSLFAN
jgi:hypothetical protein